MSALRIVKSTVSQALTNTERAELLAGKCPDCGRDSLTDIAHSEGGIHIGFETDVTCECGFAALMRPPRKGTIDKGEKQ